MAGNPYYTECSRATGWYWWAARLFHAAMSILILFYRNVLERIRERRMRRLAAEPGWTLPRFQR